MVAMPYILVNLVLESLSLILFCATSAALLSRYSLTNRYLPARLRAHRGLAFAAHGLVLLGLSIAVVSVIARGGPVFIVAQSMFEWFFYIGFANSVVLSYLFLACRVMRDAPKVQRWLLSALGAVLVPSALAIGLGAVVLRLFLIR